jgi:hypothetical protein
MRSTSTGSAPGSVTIAETRLIGTTVLSATSPNLEPSARTMIRADDAGLLVVEVRDAAAHRHPGRADDGDVGVVALDALHRGRADAAELVLADHPAGHDHPDLPGAEQARDDERLGDDEQAVPGRGQPGELLHGGPDPDEHHPRIGGQFGGPHRDLPFLEGVVQRARVLRDLEAPAGADHPGGGATVGPAHETVPVQAAQVPADGHLGYAELARQAAHLDRLVRRDPLQHLDPPLDRQHRSAPSYPWVFASDIHHDR